MRLIDADALIECIKDELYDKSSFWYKLIADALIKCIQDQPTIVKSEDLYVDMRCIETLDDELDPIDDDTSLIHMRIDDVQRALYSAAQNLWILQGGTGRRMHWEGDPCPVKLGSDANGCWIKCKDCANTRCTRRLVEDDGDDAAEEQQCKRAYDADAVDALFEGCVDPLNPTKEDQHKAYARLMLSRLRK